MAAGALVLAGIAPAAAFTVELKDVASDRIERQRAEALGMLPLPGTPNLAQRSERLAEKSLAAGSAVFVRIFKAESELEVWMQRGSRFELFATYPICHWSGTLGPKISEGDKQSPEGIYTVSQRQLHMIGRHPRSLNLGFPNVLDRQFSRTGSYILVHGGCGSVGCFAMTNPVIDEIFQLTQAALRGGQEAVHVHVFPFRMTEEKLRAFALHEWYDFWRNLKDAYDSFERTRRPPKVTVCEGRYWVDDVAENGEVASHGPLAVCATSLAAASSNSEVDNARFLPAMTPWPARSQPFPGGWFPQRLSRRHGGPSSTTPRMSSASPSNECDPLRQPTTMQTMTNPLDDPSGKPSGNPAVAKAMVRMPSAIAPVPTSCEMSLASCRRFVVLQRRVAERQWAASRRGPKLAQRRS